MKFQKVPKHNNRFRLATVAEAKAHHEDIMALLDTWTIALLNGGKMDGRGYGGQVQEGNFEGQCGDKIVVVEESKDANGCCPMGHILLYQQYERDWICDGCRGGIYSAKQFPSRYRCKQQCDYDQCNNCYNKLDGTGCPRMELGSFKELKAGLDYLVEAVCILDNQTEDTYEAAEETARQLIPVINEIRDNFKESEKIYDEKMRKIQTETEEKMHEVSQMENQIIDLKNKKEKLKYQIEGEENNLKDQIKNLEYHRERQRGQERRTKEAEENYNSGAVTRDAVTGTGIGLLAIPIVGWIAGGTMIAVGQTALKDNADHYKKVASEANDTLARIKRSVDATQNRIENSKMANRKNEEDLRSITNQKNAAEIQLKTSKQNQKEMHVVKEKIQRLSTVVKSFFSGAKTTSRAVTHAVSLGEIIVPMTDLMRTVNTGKTSLPITLQSQVAQAQVTWERIQRLQPAALENIQGW